jgi:hypothetical protein
MDGMLDYHLSTNLIHEYREQRDKKEYIHSLSNSNLALLRGSLCRLEADEYCLALDLWKEETEERHLH